MSPASQGADLSQIGRTVPLQRSHASFGDFVALMKPRVMSLVVFTALVGLLVAPGHLDPLIGFVALLCITAGAGAAGVLNMWYDADIDAVMTRTAMRPIPRGRVSRAEALAFGLMLAAGSIAVLGFAVNIAAAALLAFTIFFYVVVYTMWLKRQTPQNIVIGGAAGAFPPVIGWVAATGRIGVEPLILFLIIFLWTPPHMLPVVAGTAETKRQILIYSVLLVPISILPWALGFAGAIYGATAGMSGATIILLALQLRRSSGAEKRPARRLFAFSIVDPLRSFVYNALFGALPARGNKLVVSRTDRVFSVCVYRQFDSAWTQRTNGVSSRPDERFDQADSPERVSGSLGTKGKAISLRVSSL